MAGKRLDANAQFASSMIATFLTKFSRQFKAMAAIYIAILPFAGLCADQAQSQLAPDGKPILVAAANPAKGFNYPYILYSPAGSEQTCYPYLLVEPNNSGKPDRDPSNLSEELHDAILLATTRSLGNLVAERLRIPLLVPVFPRPLMGDSDLYTHSLSRETILISAGPLKRIDLQLIAMIGDARHRLQAAGHPVLAKALFDGYSASAMFVSRFTYLHPENVTAAAFGGVNGFIMLPLEKLHERDLHYPLGLSDYPALAGHPFDRAAYDSVPQLAFMGENDTNDAVGAGDAYSAYEAELVYSLLGKPMLPDRWKAVEAVYGRQHTAVRFKTYPAIGHGLDERIYDDVVELFRSAMAQRPGKPAACGQ